MKSGAALSEWWDASRELIDGADDGCLDQATHARILAPVYRTLIDDYDPAEAARAIEDDWQSDSGGLPMLTKECFLASIYELCDVWTEGIDADEYVGFLNNLLDRVAPRGPLRW